MVSPLFEQIAEDGEMGFLTDEDWDGEELGKLYYGNVVELMDEKGLIDLGFEPDSGGRPFAVERHLGFSLLLLKPSRCLKKI